MEKDNKSYCFVFVLNRNSWCFAVHNNIYQGNMTLLEKWEINNEIFFLARYLYTKEAAIEVIKNIDRVGKNDLFSIIGSRNTTLNLVAGTNMYCVIDGQTNQIIATVRKPNLPMLEIWYNNRCITIDEKSFYEEIKVKLINLLEKEYCGKIIPTIYGENFSHFVYF